MLFLFQLQSIVSSVYVGSFLATIDLIIAFTFYIYSKHQVACWSNAFLQKGIIFKTAFQINGAKKWCQKVGYMFIYLVLVDIRIKIRNKTNEILAKVARRVWLYKQHAQFGDSSSKKVMRYLCLAENCNKLI